MALSFKQIRYFVATAELGQISQAAVALAISQSAVTTAIKELEMTLGVDLFQRMPYGMELTDTGRRFLSHAYEIMAKMEEALSLATPQMEIRGTITVAATYTVLGYFLPYHLGRIRRLFPDLTVKIHEMSREAIEDGLLGRRYDMAVLLTSNLSNLEIASETLLSSTRRLWVCSRHPLLQAREVSFELFVDEPYIMLTVDEAAQTTQKYWPNAASRPNVLLRTSSVEAVRSMVADGQGVTLLSDMVYRPWSLDGKRIERINPSLPIPPMDVGLAWARDAEMTPIQIAFRDYFRQALQIQQGRI
ncbi:LysR family transcriptional regulator [Telmatospirillum siberiense]|uniref:LysR family transcriptional regulator n=1 Tax=Telmatospirillum siberiense TaxID=382514 RepID=A0A2N3PR23_9PROT|nr:LysR family transcriptional regulator [Telmatospirillum siberiense]PKU22853.1 LysR family transcriptional regulator [Telmatospirillum siberiense]